jgi:predicted peroxiredoxin
MRTLMLVGTTGTENPSKAVMPFVLAIGALKSKQEIRPRLALLGDAVVLLRQAVIDSLVPLGYPPLKELMAEVVQRQVELYV